MSASAGAKIIELRETLAIGQKELAKRLGTSVMSVSRWERNEALPSGAMLIRLGNLRHANPESCWDFWELAGLTPQDVSRVLPNRAESLQRILPILQIVKAGARHKMKEESLVVIPMSSLVASAGVENGSASRDLEGASLRHAIVAPKLWCPNPAHSVCMRVRGDSMEPMLQNNYIILVDQKQTNRKKLNGKIVVAHHAKFGLVVSRFWRLGGGESLVPDNRKHDPMPWSSAWQITGKVLWWIGQSS